MVFSWQIYPFQERRYIYNLIFKASYKNTRKTQCVCSLKLTKWVSSHADLSQIYLEQGLLSQSSGATLKVSDSFSLKWEWRIGIIPGSQGSSMPLVFRQHSENLALQRTTRQQVIKKILSKAVKSGAFCIFYSCTICYSSSNELPRTLS